MPAAKAKPSSSEFPPRAERECVVLDSSAVLNDFAFDFSANAEYFVTQKIFLEFRDLRSRHLAENAMRNGLLSLREPSPESLGKVEALCAKKKLRASEADKSIVALALDFKSGEKNPKLVSDDFAVQNLCSSLGINFAPIIRGSIREN
ncbi:MAG: hypothetical protein WC602_01360 [archaeon]